MERSVADFVVDCAKWHFGECQPKYCRTTIGCVIYSPTMIGSIPFLIMSSKYAFTQTLKEVRFLFCQTSDHSAATRSAALSPSIQLFS